MAFKKYLKITKKELEGDEEFMELKSDALAKFEKTTDVE